jgi:hypothetical protein
MFVDIPFLKEVVIPNKGVKLREIRENCLLSSLSFANDEMLNKSIAPTLSSLNFHDKFSLPLNACSRDIAFT